MAKMPPEGDHSTHAKPNIVDRIAPANQNSQIHISKARIFPRLRQTYLQQTKIAFSSYTALQEARRNQHCHTFESSVIAAMEPLEGSCNCGRNRYVIVIPDETSNGIAKVIFDNGHQHRMYSPEWCR